MSLSICTVLENITLEYWHTYVRGSGTEEDIRRTERIKEYCPGLQWGEPIFDVIISTDSDSKKNTSMFDKHASLVEHGYEKDMLEFNKRYYKQYYENRLISQMDYNEYQCYLKEKNK